MWLLEDAPEAPSRQQYHIIHRLPAWEAGIAVQPFTACAPSSCVPAVRVNQLALGV